MIPALAVLLLAQAAPGVDDVRVGNAIQKGIAYLRTSDSPGAGFAGIDDADELVLLTFIHAGVPASDPKFRALLEHVSNRTLERTYEAALGAMVFEELERVKYQRRIVQCGQFLVDNQCANGQWSYGKPSAFVDKVPGLRAVATSVRKRSRSGLRRFGRSKAKTKPKVVRKIPVRKMKEGPARGDNSNSQYAALGLRACHDAGILLPKDVVQRARAWWEESRHPAADGKAVASGIRGEIRGWCYDRSDVCAKTHRPYASMTAGGVGAVIIYDHILGIEWKRDPVVRSGMNWLAANWSVTENKGPVEFLSDPKTERYYYLYAVERLGMLYGTDGIGSHDWYAEGANAILDAQRENGSWSSGVSRCKPTWDTCFAILFLKRATRPLVASEDPNKSGR